MTKKASTPPTLHHPSAMTYALIGIVAVVAVVAIFLLIHEKTTSRGYAGTPYGSRVGACQQYSQDKLMTYTDGGGDSYLVKLTWIECNGRVVVVSMIDTATGNPVH